MENLTFNCEIFRIIVALKEVTILLYTITDTLFVILQLYNYFEDSNYVYLILEMCHNSEINRYLKKTGRPVGENEGTDRLMFSLTSIEELIDNSR